MEHWQHIRFYGHRSSKKQLQPEETPTHPLEAHITPTGSYGTEWSKIDSWESISLEETDNFVGWVKKWISKRWKVRRLATQDAFPTSNRQKLLLFLCLRSIIPMYLKSTGQWLFYRWISRMNCHLRSWYIDLLETTIKLPSWRRNSNSGVKIQKD